MTRNVSRLIWLSENEKIKIHQSEKEEYKEQYENGPKYWYHVAGSLRYSVCFGGSFVTFKNPMDAFLYAKQKL